MMITVMIMYRKLPKVYKTWICKLPRHSVKYAENQVQCESRNHRSKELNKYNKTFIKNK